MAVTTTYLFSFPPPVSKHLLLSAAISMPTPVYTPPPDSFHSFPLLPFELQHQIWTEAAREWIKEYLERVNTWTVDALEENNEGNTINNNSQDNGNKESSSHRRIFLIHITSNPRYRRQSPNLLWACSASRSVFYNALLHAQSEKRVQRDSNVQLFMRRCTLPTMGMSRPRIFGCRIQDFGFQGLKRRVQEEKERMEQMGVELGQVREEMEVDAEMAPLGYVRLPLLNGLGREWCEDGGGRVTVRYLYPRVDMGV